MVRGTTILRRVLAIPAVRVVGAELVHEALVVDVRLRSRRLRCPARPFNTRAVYDRRSLLLWRHLGLGARRCFLRMPLRRLRCPAHGVVTEAVPFAPPRSGYTYAFEHLVAWLAQRSDKTAITQLVRVSWRSVGRILERWIARHRSGDVLDGLTRINVDEKSWRKGHRYVTVVAEPGPPARSGRSAALTKLRKSRSAWDAPMSAVMPRASRLLVSTQTAPWVSPAWPTTLSGSSRTAPSHTPPSRGSLRRRATSRRRKRGACARPAAARDPGRSASRRA